MGFCTTVEKEAFMQTVPQFEAMLIDSGVRIIKYYLDISKEEQAQRLADRRRDPLKQWKISPIDEVSLEHWDDYSVARDEMFLRTSSEHSPWFVVQANNKRRARLNVIRHLLAQIDYPGASDEIRAPKAGIVAKFDPHLIESGRVAG
jgi:polyphosphate kinase 2 (PPK2 family)